MDGLLTLLLNPAQIIAIFTIIFTVIHLVCLLTQYVNKALYS